MLKIIKLINTMPSIHYCLLCFTINCLTISLNKLMYFCPPNLNKIEKS